MANTPFSNPAATLGDAARFGEIRSRIFFLIGALVVYRIGTFIPVPGIDAAKFAQFFSGQQGTLLGMFNMFSGGALQRFSIFALNVMPYITASIIVQMASMVYAPWNQIRKDGESGRRKLMQYTRYGTVGLAAFQGFGAALAIQNPDGRPRRPTIIRKIAESGRSWCAAVIVLEIHLAPPASAGEHIFAAAAQGEWSRPRR